MNESIKEYVQYLQRQKINSTKTLRELSMLSLNREVAFGYGLNAKQINEIDFSEYETINN